MTRELVLEVVVLGEAKPAGSKRAFRNPKTGKLIVTDANKGSRPWKQEVAGEAGACPRCHGDGEITFNPSRILDPQEERPAGCRACHGTGARFPELLAGPLAVEFVFYRPRPKGHFRTGKNAHLLRDSAPAYPATVPDVLKLARGVEDAMQGVVYRNDAQIVEQTLRKAFGEPARAEIRVWTLSESLQPVLQEVA